MKDIFFKKFLIKNNFRNIFDKRVINSIYFDTTDLKFFTENVEGVSEKKGKTKMV